MNIIQIVLLAAFSFLFLLYFSLWRKGILDKLIVFIIIILGIIFIIMPNWLTNVANLIGIGRGADLLIYLSIVFFSFIIIILFANIRRIERIQTEIVRNNAIRNKKKGGVRKSN